MGCLERPTRCPFTGPVIWYQASAGNGRSQRLPSMASSALTLRAAPASRWLRSLAPAGGPSTMHGRIKLWTRRPKGNCVLSARS
jgi:hypothetical protein